MDIAKIYAQYGIITASQGHKHYRAGWIQTPCPFCTGTPGFHLGYNLIDDYFNCWRCGYKNKFLAVSKVLGCTVKEAKNIIRESSGLSSLKKVKKVKVQRKSFKLPPHTIPITKSKYQLKYMLRRGFTRKQIFLLQKRFKIQCTSNISKIDNMNLKFRIVAPIIWKDKIVSWQTRDCTGTNGLKYITCPKSREIEHHKHILYDPPENKEILILTEGIFDVWKIFLSGYDISTCGFGVEITDEQILLLKKYKTVLVWLDPDSAGKKKTRELLNRLLFAGVNIDTIENPFLNDPGDLEIPQIQEVLSVYL